METHLAGFIRDTRAGREAEAVLRRCVHCGFCTATCPTYQLTGDELDGPRGRIYLIKQLLEVGVAGEVTRVHLDRCLSCRSCETTCPSGVQYARLLDIGRELLEARVPRPWPGRLERAALRGFLSRRWLFEPALRVAQWLRARVPERRDPGPWPPPRHARRMLLLAGCVQPAMLPGINAATARVFECLGISLLEARGRNGAGCCGALRQHLDDAAGARADARRNIDAWWPLLEGGCEAIVMTASACGLQVRDYGHLLADDPSYARQAERVAQATCDVSEALAAEKGTLLALLQSVAATRAAPAGAAGGLRVAFHSPCTLQHGQQIRGAVEELLVAAGCELAAVADAHLCCGSAGTYSLLQPELSTRLRAGKLATLTAGSPQVIASANVGCIAHLQSGSALPVRHWIELLDAALGGAQPAPGVAPASRRYIT